MTEKKGEIQTPQTSDPTMMDQYGSDMQAMLVFIGNDIPTTTDRLEASAAFHRLMMMLRNCLKIERDGS